MSSRWSQIAILVAVALAAAGAVAVASIALGGGGGGGSASQDEYQETVVRTRNQVEFALAKIPNAESIEELLAELDDAAVVVEASAADLADSGVAEGLEDENDELVAAVDALSSELAGTASTLRDPTFAEALPQLTSLSFKQWVVVNRILADLKEQGIDVEPLARH